MPGDAEAWIAIATTDERQSAELALVLTARHRASANAKPARLGSGSEPAMLRPPPAS